MKTIVLYHSADYDGLFSREVAKKWLPKDTEFMGWDFADGPILFPNADEIYIIDLPPERLFTRRLTLEEKEKIIWIDHHHSNIAEYEGKYEFKGYRIDGVAACRLAWQWFKSFPENAEPNFAGRGVEQSVPKKQYFVDRRVAEPRALTLAGEYDIWDHRNDGDLEFQFGLDSQKNIPWELLLEESERGRETANKIVADGQSAMQCYAKRDADVMKSRSFLVNWEGLKFLALNTPKCNSNTFAFLDKKETGHDALLAFFWNGKAWIFSLYHAKHRKDLDLSLIAVKHGGGGHAGACGFNLNELPF